MYSTCIENNRFTLFVEKEQGLVFHHSSKELFILDQMSVWLLQQIEAGATQPNLELLLQQELAIDYGAAVEITTPLFALYSEKAPSGLYSQTEFPEIGTIAAWAKDVAPKTVIDLGSCVVAIASDNDGLNNALTKLLSPIICDHQHFDFCIQLQTDNQSTTLYVNGIQIETFDSIDMVVPAIISRIQVLTYQSQNYLFSFHGGAVSYKNCCVILPGISGAGKSTLKAKLCANQALLYSDEMAVIGPDSKIRVIQLPIAVKSGSWDVLMNDYPELAAAQVFDREDGKKIKYIWPKDYASDGVTEDKIVVINPEFNAINADKKGIEEQPISMINALETMTNSGHQVGTELDFQAVSTLLNLLKSSSCYRIRFSEAACQFIQTLCKLNTDISATQLHLNEPN